MTEGKKMLRDMGYELASEDCTEEIWMYNEYRSIIFKKEIKFVRLERKKLCMFPQKNTIDESGITIDMEELMAINTRCKELGWI